ncbi:uncharacterized protein [Populus alba]|uniref:uncharacterized protein n=1 Tax=Populus alba TaxID=43335 RepID=UPI003CC72743
MNLKERLTATTRGSSFVGEFLNTMRSIFDELSIIGEPPSDIDLVVHVLNGLCPAFKEIVAAIRAYDNPISFEDLLDKLVEYENFLKREEVRAMSPPITAHVTQRSGQFSTSTPKHYNNNKVSSNNRGYQSFSISNHAPTAIYTTTTSLKPQNWLLDSTTSHHLIDDLNNLSLTSAYEGSNAIVIGDDIGLQITHADHATLPTPSKDFALSNLLRELHASSPAPPTVYFDNMGATYLCANPVFHSCMKHIDIDFHFVRDHVSKGQLRVFHVSTTNQLADALTKPLSR